MGCIIILGSAELQRAAVTHVQQCQQPIDEVMHQRTIGIPFVILKMIVNEIFVKAFRRDKPADEAGVDVGVMLPPNADYGLSQRAAIIVLPTPLPADGADGLRSRAVELLRTLPVVASVKLTVGGGEEIPRGLSVFQGGHLFAGHIGVLQL